jgi:hypothetical protein
MTIAPLAWVIGEGIWRTKGVWRSGYQGAWVKALGETVVEYEVKGWLFEG